MHLYHCISCGLELTPEPRLPVQPHCPQVPGSDASATPTHLCKKTVFLGFSHLFPSHALGEEGLHPHREEGGDPILLTPSSMASRRAGLAQHTKPGHSTDPARSRSGSTGTRGTLFRAGHYPPPPCGGRSTRGHQRDVP